MSQSVRRLLAAFGLTATLLFAAPAPSRAAGLREIPTVSDLTARLAVWLHGLLPGAQRREKQTATPSPSSPTAPPSSTSSDQGSAIDPNGVHR